MDFNWGAAMDFTTYVKDLRSATIRVYGKPDVIIHQAVLTEPRTWRELDPTNAQVIRQGQLFIWPKRMSPEPPVGCTIIDEDGTRWIAWRVLYKDIVDTWEVTCLNLSIVLGPNAQNAKPNLATVLVASYVKGEANEAKAVWRGLFTGKRRAVTNPKANPTDTIPARFQPILEASQIQFGSEGSRETYAVYFDNPWPREVAGGEYRIVSPDGDRFQVMEYIKESRIESLPIAMAIRIVQGSEFWDDGVPPVIDT